MHMRERCCIVYEVLEVSVRLSAASGLALRSAPLAMDSAALNLRLNAFNQRDELLLRPPRPRAPQGRPRLPLAPGLRLSRRNARLVSPSAGARPRGGGAGRGRARRTDSGVRAVAYALQSPARPGVPALRVKKRSAITLSTAPSGMSNRLTDQQQQHQT